MYLAVMNSFESLPAWHVTGRLASTNLTLNVRCGDWAPGFPAATRRRELTDPPGAIWVNWAKGHGLYIVPTLRQKLSHIHISRASVHRIQNVS